jgi:Ca2+-binding EF-hand superfamily protein
MIQTVQQADEEKKEKFKGSDASNTLRKVSHTPVHKLKNVMFKKMLLKLILYFYEERTKERSNVEHFCDFVFNCLMKKYIMKKAAESKFHHLLASCVKYKFIIRVRVFGRFLGLYDGFDTEDLNFYIECLQFFQNLPLGTITISQDSLENIWVPYFRCTECIKFFEKVLPKAEIPSLKARLEKMKREDKVSKQGVVDFDEFLEQLVETHNDHNKSTKHFMESIYGAADLNDDGYLQLKEFELLMRFLSSYQFKEITVRRLFDEYAENFMSEEDDEIKAISFENLCQMNLTHKVFQAGNVKNFTGVSNGEEALEKLEIMEPVVEDLINEIHWRFSETQTWEEHIDELTALLGIIKSKIYAKRSPEKTFLAYSLIECESKRIIIEERMKEFLPNFAYGF